MNTANLVFFGLKTIHYIVSGGLIFVVLLQTGKSGGMMGIFGGGSEQIFNAPSGIAFIKKVTIVMACIFLFTSLMLTKVSTNMSMVSVVNQLSKIPVNAPVEPLE
ncbi:MAG: preprotein translocase subunit SecG [Endomicrobium sp.]|jgi:preprotein translocase subunit SecG|nr:preprotein translocase subunit SecG [Endomicrobium sp.]